jgi:hypothetical protein
MGQNDGQTFLAKIKTKETFLKKEATMNKKEVNKTENYCTTVHYDIDLSILHGI